MDKLNKLICNGKICGVVTHDCWLEVSHRSVILCVAIYGRHETSGAF